MAARFLGKAFDSACDGENNPVEFDYAYPVKRRLAAALNELQVLHDGALFLLPMSGTSCGGGIFQPAARPPGSVLGLRFDAPPEARVSRVETPRLDLVELDEIQIDHASRRVAAGAAVTLEQLNRALAQHLGPAYRVAGADLTSYQYAAVGATFMTGGMGPQRRYFSDSVDAVALHDGKKIRLLEGEALRGYAGSYGWSGIVAAVRCRYFEYPVNEIAFALPVSHAAGALARLLERFAPWAFLELTPAGVVSRASERDLILGIEHVSVAALELLLQHDAAHPAAAQARSLRGKCAAAKADGLLFVNALSKRDIDAWLLDLADDADAEMPSITGIDLEHAEVFPNSDIMRDLREAIPYAARMREPSGALVYKNHTDANVCIDPGSVAASVERLWRINDDYVGAVQRHFTAYGDIRGDILVYGHLNPFGFDPHNRVTLASDDAKAFERSREFLLEARSSYYRAVAEFCARGKDVFVGGEKTADSEIAIMRALGGAAELPSALRARFECQRQRIRAAAPMFNWRAPPPYR